MTKAILISIVCLVLTIGAFLLLDYSFILWAGFIMPKREKVRRKVFVNTKSYIEGKKQDLIHYRLLG